MELLKEIYKTLDERKAEDIRIYVSNSPIFEYMVIATATSERLLEALANYVKDTCNIHKVAYNGIEKSDTWILIDCKSIIVNLFTKDSRDYYGMDKLYLGSEQIDVEKL